MINDTDPPDADDDLLPDLLEQTVDAARVGEPVSQVRKRERDRRETEAFWKSVFASEVGRREMWGILESAKVFEDIFACGPNGFPQPEASWFHAGAKALGQRIYHGWTTLDREGVFRMLDEHDPRFKRPKPRAKKKRVE